jgi:hypothetical protein
MSLITPTEFKVVFERFACKPDPVIQFWLDYAEARCPPEIWSDRRAQGIQFLTVHCLDMNTVQDLQIASLIKTVGSGNASSLPVNAIEYLDQTPYGKLFKVEQENLMHTASSIWAMP